MKYIFDVGVEVEAKDEDEAWRKMKYKVWREQGLVVNVYEEDAP